MIMAGQIFINNSKVLKSGDIYHNDVDIFCKSLHPNWVSRGALKLLHAIDHFKIDVANLKCLDIGASTGGFTEVLLSKKAKKIYSVDVGTNQLHEKLQNNNKVINISKTNARYLTKKILPELLDLIVCDVSFISMKKVIYPSLIFLEEKFGIIIGLIKPQFESEKKELTKEQQKELEILSAEIEAEAIQMKLDYEKNPSEESGSVVVVHHESEYLDEEE